MDIADEYEVFAAVAAVISAFHGGAELLACVKKRRSQGSSDFGHDEGRQLQISLETAELQLGFRFSTEETRFGDIVRVGDAIARDRLLHIAVVIQTEIIMRLQLVARYENAVIDFKTLHAAATANRTDAIHALDELKQRILLQRPSLCTRSVAINSSSDAHGFSMSTAASRRSISDASLPNAVSKSIRGDLQSGLSSNLVRYFYAQRRGRAVLNTQDYLHLLGAADRSNDFRLALHYLLQGKTSQEQALIMKDIDEIIAAYQGLRIEGDRADTLAKLTGHEETSKRDTLAVLQGGFGHQRHTKMLHQDALRLLKELPPLPKSENKQYPAYNHDVLDRDDDRRLSKWVEEQRQQPIPVVSRWSSTSAGSSVYSEHTVYSSEPPSLYHDDSRSSSRASGISPVEPVIPATQYLPSKPNSAHGNMPFWSLDTMRNPRSPASLTSSRTPSPMRQPGSRANSLMPTFASQRPTTPASSTAWSRNTSPEPRGRPRDHLHPKDKIDTAPMLHFLRPVASSSQLSITPSVKSTVTTGAQEKMMNGRPCKDNNYWGFCKGAWGAREDAKKGLVLTARPEGMYSSSQVWQCRHCLFEGRSCTVPHPTKKNKTETGFDTKIHVSFAGIRYRWSFLAKSHVKKTNYSSAGRNASGEDMECNYGCVICSVEGAVTGVYGSVETLMDHIAHEHVYMGNMSAMTMMRSKIVVGRMAGNDEEWDVNIPSQDGLIF